MTTRVSGQVNPQDVAQLRQRLEEMRQQLRVLEQGDVILEAGRRALFRSPNRTYWSLTVSDAGAVVLTNVGTTL